MPHRGRLNVLANVMAKPYRIIFHEFSGGSANPDDVGGSGDVKYHLGTSTDIEIDGRQIHLSLQPNPSHLEAVDPVVIGKVRARQDKSGDTTERASVMGILLHGDAAFAGQGLVYETLAMSQLVGYRTGGTIHIVTNNQVGFTTGPDEARSGRHCTEIAKFVEAPIFHVNGDDPDAVILVTEIALEYRQQFAADAVVDIVCYRRYGHNETDEPLFTQPILYKNISSHPSVTELYSSRLTESGSAPGGELQSLRTEFDILLNAAQDRARASLEADLANKPAPQLKPFLLIQTIRLPTVHPV
jgi:2-oxoglutarate dehydrogenase E1 component